MGKLLHIRLIASLSLLPLLAGCAGSIGENSSQNSDTSNPSPTFDTSDGRAPARGDIDQSGSIFTVPKSVFEETVWETRDDEFGQYAVTRISYPSIDSVNNKGVDKEKLISALEFYTDFVSSEVLDSIALDNNANYEKWVKESAPKYIAEEFFDEIVNAQENGSFSGVIFNNYDSGKPNSYARNLIPVLVRDGGPRLFNKHMWDLKAEPSNRGIDLSGQGAGTVITSDEPYLAWDRIVFGPGGETFPQFRDGKPQAAQMRFQILLTLIPDGENWKIAAFSSSFSLDASQFISDAPQNLLDWRDAIR